MMNYGTMYTQKFLLVGLFLLIGLATLRGQDADDRSDLKAALSDLGEQYRSWLDKEVVPRLREWKEELDRSLSAEDLQTLNALRRRAKETGLAIRENRRATRQAWSDHRDGDWQLLHEEGRLLRKEMMDITGQVVPLVARYRTTLEALTAKARPVFRAWREQRREILSEWRKKHQWEADGSGIAALRNMHRGDLMFRPFILRRAVRFMLWSDSGESDGVVPDVAGPELN